MDDYSCFVHIELIRDNSDSLLEAFKVFKAFPELQKGEEKKIKSLKSDRGGEYYGIYDEIG